MIVELQRFVEFGADYFSNEPRRKSDLVFEPMTINTDYIAWVHREDCGPFEMCVFHMADRGGNFRFDITYKKACALMRARRKAA